MLDTQPQPAPAPQRKKKVRKVAQQLEPLFTPDEIAESELLADWTVPFRPATELPAAWSNDELQQLAQQALSELQAAP